MLNLNKNKFTKERIFVFGIIFLLLTIPFSSAVSVTGFSSSSSNPNYYQHTFQSYSQTKAYDYWPILKQSDKCEATTDFMMFIQPGGCSPSVVRSDLLEEQNVPVFCKVDIVKLNPLVDITQIKSVKFQSESLSPFVAGVSFHPNREAITGQKSYLDKPLINDVGYVVVLLKQIEKEDDMPESIKVNVTGVLKYDIENFFGAGKNSYYLDVVEDSEFKNPDNYKEDGFWRGRGYLRAEGVEGNTAQISIYRNPDEKLASFKLQEGETSKVYYMPGFYCKAGLQVKLDDVKAPVQRVLLEVDGDKMWMIEGESFLDSQCKVLDININEKAKETKRKIEVKIKCKAKTETLDLSQEKNKSGSWITKTIVDEPESLQDNADVLTSDMQTYFENAKKKAKETANEYGSAYEGEEGLTTIWGAKALLEAAQLADRLGQKATARDLFSELIDKYPDTTYADSAKDEIINLYNQVENIDYKEHYIRFLNFKTPSVDEASAEFELKKIEDGKLGDSIAIPEKIQEKQAIYEGKSDIELVKIDTGKVEVKYKTGFELEEGESKLLPLNCEESEKDKNECEYKLTLKRINIKEIAKVSLVSKMPNEYSEADFSFEIGIDKRAIQLTPEKAKEKIKNLNEQIAKWEERVEQLGNLVKGWKGACLATSTYLFITSFFSNLGGGATARQQVMPVYYGMCKDVADSETKFNECLNKYNKEIEKDIKIYKEKVDGLNKEIIALQEKNKDPKSGFVNRKAVVDKLKENYPNVDGLDGITEDIERARNLITYNLISNSDASQYLRNDLASKQENLVDKIQETKNKVGSLYIIDEKDRTLDNFVGNTKAVYYSTTKAEGLVYKVPVPVEFQTESGKIAGFVAVLDEKDYDASGDFKTFSIYNVGENNYLELSEDEQFGVRNDMFNANEDFFKDIPEPFGLKDAKEFKKLVQSSIQAIQTANRNSNQKSFKLFQKTINVNIQETVFGGKRCADFMSPKNCAILFNVCDPVLCPASRCNLGGNYQVDNVVSSGIIGSIALCLPNSKLLGGDIYTLPVCLTGIHAGLDNWVTIMKSYRDCLQTRVDTGKYVGFCDEVYSIELCDFFWRQIGPFLDVLFLSLLERMYGEGMKGGGEYLTVKDAWANLDNTVAWMKNDYAVNAVNAFNARSSGEVGAEICRNFVSTRYPNSKEFFDNLLEPDSPVQFHAWFDEIKYSDVTVPATSQYKVYYYIYAGKDEGASYQVYLTSPEKSTYVNVQETVVVDTNFIPIGGYVSQTRDFTAPSGYKNLCVRINGKDECGFKQVSSGFALNYLTDKYYEEQAMQRVTTEKECISGTPSAYSLLQPNLQAGVEETINPELKGIIRICSSKELDKSEQDRWVSVGSCDSENVICWLDKESVKDVIKNKAIEKTAVGEIDVTAELEKLRVASDSEISEAFDKANKLIEEIKKSGVTEEITDEHDVMKALEYIRTKAVGDGVKARAGYYEFKIYATIADKLWEKRVSVVSEEAVTETAAEQEETAAETEAAETEVKTSKTGFSLEGNKIYLNGDYTKLYVNELGTLGKIASKDKYTHRIYLDETLDRVIGYIDNNGNIIIESSDSSLDKGTIEILQKLKTYTFDGEKFIPKE